MMVRGARALLLATVMATGFGCAASTPDVAMVKVDGEVATLSYALKVAPGDGTMAKLTADATRNALIASGFRLSDEKEADVVLELAVSDVEQKSFIVMTVNGKQQIKRAVTASMRAVGKDGKTIDQHVAKFVATQDEEVPEGKLAALTNHFAKSSELERYSLERQIERVRDGGSPDGEEGEDVAPRGKGDPKPVKADPGGGQGKLPREAIEKVVRSHNSSIRLCYERGLAEDPTLAGMVQVTFLIGLDGTVSAAETGPRTDLPDPSVVACVKKAFTKMEFPMPEGGSVKVSYPIDLKPQ